MSAFWERLDAQFADQIATGRAETAARVGKKLGGSDLWLPATLEEHHELHREISSYHNASESKWIEWTRAYAEASLFHLSRFVLSTKNDKWLVRGKQALDHELPLRFCDWLQYCEKDTLFLLSREHDKSTLSTLCRTIHIIIETPNKTQAIISDTLKLARSFARQNQREMESNPLLHHLWPDIFYADPKHESDQWSVGESSSGLVVRRQTNVKEATITPVGLDSAPETGPHYDVRRHDDIVTARNTASTAAMGKTRRNLKKSASLGKDGGYPTYVGTTYHPLDAYHDLENQGRVKRVVNVPCYEDIEEKTGPTYYSIEYLQEKEVQCGPEEFATQWLLSPSSGRMEQLDIELLRYYDPEDLIQDRSGKRTRREEYARCGNTYMTVDGAGGEKENTTDFTVMQVWSTQPDESIVLLDAVHDRIDPDARVNAAMQLYLKWGQYRFQNCRWEQYAMDSDVFWMERRMTETSNWFQIIKVAGQSRTAGMRAKTDRITGRLFPVVKRRQIILPDQLLIPCQYLGGGDLDYTQVFVEQLEKWPLTDFDDDLDCASRMFEPNHPLAYPDRPMKERYEDAYARQSRLNRQGGESNWVA